MLYLCPVPLQLQQRPQIRQPIRLCPSQSQGVEPIQQLGGTGLLLQCGQGADPVEYLQRSVEPFRRQRIQSGVDGEDGTHFVFLRKGDDIEQTAPEKGGGQFLFSVGGQEHQGGMPSLDDRSRLGNLELSPFQLPQ